MIHVLIDSTVPLIMYLHGVPQGPAKPAIQRPMPLESAQVMAAPIRGDIVAYMTPVAYSNTYYFLRKHLPLARANAHAEDVLKVALIIPQSRPMFRAALASGWKDVEDAGQAIAASLHGAITLICTNNVKDFMPMPGIEVVNPAELLAQV